MTANPETPRPVRRNGPRKPRVLGAALVAAVAAWLSQGIVAFTHAGGHRIAMLPVSPAAFILVVGVALLVALLMRASGSRAPRALLLFLCLPWIPADVPPVFYLWLRPLTVLIWTAVIAIMVAAVLRRHGATLRIMRGRPARVACAMAFAMVALSLVWRVRPSDGLAVASAQVEMLRHISRAARVVAVDMDALRPVSRDNIPGRLRIELSREVPPRAASRALSREVLFAVRALPAGEYRVTPVVSEQRGWMMVGVGRDQFALVTAPLSTLTDGVDIRLAANVGELVVRGDEDARQVVRALLIEPLAVLPTSMRATNALAGRAVRYGAATVFFVDGHSYAEPEAFWVSGAASSSVVLQPDERGASMELHLRNAPIDNRVQLEAGAWREDMALKPGEERRIRVPLDGTRDATLLHLSSSAGFRPSAVDPNSRDDRYFGIRVRVAPSTASAASVEPQQP